MDMHPLQVRVRSQGGEGQQPIAASPLESFVSCFWLLCFEANTSKSTLSFIRKC